MNAIYKLINASTDYITVQEALLELARLQAIAEAAEKLAERLMVRRVYGWLNTSEADALAAYKKAKAGEQ